MAEVQHKQRNTIRNAFYYLGRGDIRELLKIARRRFLHLLRYIKIGIFRVIGVYYFNPSVEKKRHQRQLRRLMADVYDWSPADWNYAQTRIAIIAREGDSYPKSSAFIRLISPLTDPALKQTVSIRLYPENSYDLSSRTNVCIVQRNAFDSVSGAERLVKYLHTIGASLILDSDDAFHSIDAKHPEHDSHRSTLDAFEYLLKNADQVWASTLRLAEFFKSYNHNVHLVSNSLDKRLWKERRSLKITARGDKPIEFLYMGTVSHNADFEMIFPALDEVAKKYPGSFRLTVIGVASDLPDRPWIQRVYQKRGGSIYPRFMPWLNKLGPFDIGISPLVDSDFNRSKSDIKCLDYIAFRTIPLVSDVEPYQSAELDNYIVRVNDTTKGWQDTLSKIVANPMAFRATYEPKLREASEYLWGRRTSGVTAQRMLELLASENGETTSE